MCNMCSHYTTVFPWTTSFNNHSIIMSVYDDLQVTNENIDMSSAQGTTR